jgi:hypothetical protein
MGHFDRRPVRVAQWPERTRSESSEMLRAKKHLAQIRKVFQCSEISPLRYGAALLRLHSGRNDFPFIPTRTPISRNPFAASA